MDPSTVVTKSMKLTGFITEKQSKVYSSVKTLRKKTNNRYNTRFTKGILQYNLGNWVLMSSANTHRARQKKNIRWKGSFQVVTMIYPNVYRFRNLLEKETVCHESCIWWYEPPEYSASENVIKHFKWNYGTLSVEGIYDIKLTPEGQSLKRKWLGFEEDSTFEPLEILTEDVPLLAKDFFTGRRRIQEAAEKNVFEVVVQILIRENEALQLNAICFFCKKPFRG
eukprot:snap_masked-scaffold_23-processed-gene-0.22-mRNA-1 protein AED:1.00 eAED:1.00 QI:0/-1/0/0/-1/1/1/0/223